MGLGLVSLAAVPVLIAALMPTCRGRKIAVDVARGLHFLHSNKIVHLDLK